MKPSSSSSPTTPSYRTVRAPRGSRAEYLDGSSPIEEHTGPDCERYQRQCGGTETQMWRRALEREVIERRHLEEEALLDRRRRDLESAMGPTIPKTMKGPDAPTESERAAREITHRPPAPWSETCVLGRGIESRCLALCVGT